MNQYKALIEWAPITDVRPNPNNPRVIRDAKFKELCKSVSEFPEMMSLRPIVIDDTGMALGGNMRLEACKALGWNEIPIVRAHHLTPDKIRRFIITDNIPFGEWDWDRLANEWDEAELMAWGMEIPGFDEDDNSDQAKEDDYAEPDNIKIDIKPGDIIQIGPHRIMCGDSTKAESYAQLMGDVLADLIVTDPPYNVDYEGKTKDKLKIKSDKMSDGGFDDFLMAAFTGMRTVTKSGGAWYVWHADVKGLAFRNAMEQAGIPIRQCLIWVKNAITMGRSDYQWKHEPCLYGWKEGAGHYFTDDRTKQTVIEDKIDVRKMTKPEMRELLEKMLADSTLTTILRADKPFRSQYHPTMKPILLLAPLIANSSRKGETVLDPFLGSASTMVAAHQLGRTCYGIEFDPKYCQVAVDRMIKLDPELRLTKNGEAWNPEPQY